MENCFLHIRPRTIPLHIFIPGCMVFHRSCNYKYSLSESSGPERRRGRIWQAIRPPGIIAIGGMDGDLVELNFRHILLRSAALRHTSNFKVQSLPSACFSKIFPSVPRLLAARPRLLFRHHLAKSCVIPSPNGINGGSYSTIDLQPDIPALPFTIRAGSTVPVPRYTVQSHIPQILTHTEISDSCEIFI